MVNLKPAEFANVTHQQGARDIAIGDTLTEDVCIARGQAHEKFAWMLRSHLR